MNTSLRFLLASATLALAAPLALAQPITTAFTYQGRLDSGGIPASGTYDLQFKLFTPAGIQVGATLCLDNVAVTDGAFSAPLDFGAVFDGTQRVIEIAVRPDTGLPCANPAGFTILAPRQALVASPYALFALTAGSTSLLAGQPAAFYQNAANLSSGTIPSARLSGTYSAPLTLNNASNVLAGSGSAITALNAANLSAGTLPDARLSANIALRAAGNTFTAPNTFSAAATFTGPLSFAGANFSAPLIHAGGTQIPLQLSSTNPGGTWLTLVNSSAGGRDWGWISSGSANGEGPGKLLLRDGSAGAVRAAFDVAGNLGLGTVAPASKLDVAGAVNATGLAIAGTGSVSGSLTGNAALRVTNSAGGNGTSYGLAGVATYSGSSLFVSAHGVYGEAAGIASSAGVLGRNISTGANSGYGVWGLTSGEGGAGVRGDITSSTAGGYGVHGKSASGNAIGVFGQSTTNGVGVMGQSVSGSAIAAYSGTGGQTLYAERTANGNKAWLGGLNEAAWAEANSGNGLVALTNDGNNAGLYCRNSQPSGLALNCDGRAQVKVITILGGADLAEQFPMAESTPAMAAEPGSVVAIDADHPGQMTLACGAYCPRVAGVVSGANGLSAGMVLSDGAPGPRERPIALSGRVWVKCDAATGSIEPGDLLTTSATPGHAMKAADRDRAYGAVIGKAMTRLAHGEKGLVLVLVTLQ